MKKLNEFTKIKNKKLLFLLNYAQLELIEQSDMEVFEIKKDEKITGLCIKLSGKLAELPSIKNNKIVTNNRAIVTGAHSVNKLVAITVLFKDRCDFKGFGNERVFVMCVNGKRNKIFDVDNTLNSVCDLLQSDVSTRTWGLGLINNDNQITAMSVHSEHVELNDNEDTYIVIHRLDSVSVEVISFFQEMIKLKGVIQ